MAALKLGDKPEDQLTSEEKSSLNWARNILAEEELALVHLKGKNL